MALMREWVEHHAKGIDRVMEMGMACSDAGNLAELCRFWLAHQWQPIETAPKDGTAIFALWGFASPGSASNYAVAKFDGGAWGPADENEDGMWCEPTHWQPLPEPPLPHAKEDAKV